MLCVEFPQVHYTNLSKLLPVLKAAALVTSGHSNFMIFLNTLTMALSALVH